MTIQSATLTISPDEPAFNLREVALPAPDFKGRHRYQVVTVVRGDRLVEWWNDLGDAKAFKARQFRIVAGVVDEQTGRGVSFHSVGEVLAMADQERALEGMDAPWPSEVSVDWAQAYHDEVDRRRLEASRKGVNGPYFSKMR
jgi:hypothetical protein